MQAPQQCLVIVTTVCRRVPQMDQTTTNRVVTLTCGVALTIMIGWLLAIGQTILLPVLLAVIAVYILTTAAEALGDMPGFRLLGRRWRRLLVLIGILVIVLLLSAFITSNAQAISNAIPDYSRNLGVLHERFVDLVGLDVEPALEQLGHQLLDWLDFTVLMPLVLSTLSNTGSVIIAAALYAAFIMADLDHLPQKTRMALGETSQAEQTLQIVRKANDRIGSYLAAKTLVNIILAVASLVILEALSIEFAVFWALLIGLLNYIPYIGSVIGVVFPVTLSLVQYGTLGHAATLLVLLMIAQSAVAYYLEPKMLGRSANLSPFMVLLALAVWTSLWGVMGAILAVPLTAMIAIILAEFPATRFIAVLMSDSSGL